MSRIFLALIGLVLFVGCGPRTFKTYPVSGRVEFADGSPVHVGTVECISGDHGVRSTGSINQDGSFRLTTYKDGDGAIEGDHKVVVVQFVMTENIPNYRPSSLGVVHKKYASYSTSGLSMRIDGKTENRVRLVVSGPDPIVNTDADHGHDTSNAIPASETQEKK